MNGQWTAAPLLKAAAALALLGGGAACNALSGVGEIDFTRAPAAAGGGGAGGGGTDGGGAAGGAGGAAGTYDLTCGDGNMAIGLYGRSGAWMDAIGLICAPLADDGTLGEPFETELAGGNGGSPDESTCPAGEVLVGIDIWVDDARAYRVDLRCQTPAQWKIDDSSTNTVQGLGVAQSTKFGVLCPEGYAIQRIKGEGDVFVYSVNPFCGIL